LRTAPHIFFAMSLQPAIRGDELLNIRRSDLASSCAQAVHMSRSLIKVSLEETSRRASVAMGDRRVNFDASQRYAGDYSAALTEESSRVRTLDVVTLNIEFARRVDRARLLFANVDALARATIVLLQEMDAEGTAALAASLQMSYVYYPATVHRKTGRHFGNAVLSRWPIVRDERLVLPHSSIRDRSSRIATSATLSTSLGTVEVCSLHIATPLELSPSKRREQVRAVLTRLHGAPRVVIGGDFNSYRICTLARAHAFEWTTRTIGRTCSILSVDHIFVHGLRALEVGKVTDTLGATDHAAVWARLVNT
jgi:endonuclease/exonuclease/phosphatase family metal-dependent hydrolase